MGGNLVWIVLVAGLAIYLGRSWERAARAASDVRQVRARVSRLRATRSRESMHALIVIGGSLAVLLLIARWG
jgi:hypothetical protein